ncbi:MAG: NAD-dependent malic enzyme [Gemmataceae bacterium]
MIDIRQVPDGPTGTVAVEVPLRGRLLLDCPVLNKGSAFPDDERRALGLLGLLPPHVSTIDEQAARRYDEYRVIQTPLERFRFLSALQDRNETLFYRLVDDHLAEMLPVIYTPEVGEVCQRYSHIYHRARGLCIAYPDRQDIDAILANRPYKDVDVIVVTDGERILGLGDQGIGGIGIPIGKLALYTACGGVDPARTLPIVLDVGTNNPERLADPDYLGWRHERVRGAEYDGFIDAFVEAVKRQMPGVLLQWEDFAQANARRLLLRYRDQLCTFNDDIQGTAAVTLAALLAGARATGSRVSEGRFVLLGAGSAATGIADLLLMAMRQEGLTDADARGRLWLLGSRGLLHTGIRDLPTGQEAYCQPEARVAGWRRDEAGRIPLLEVIERVQPTALIGVCGQPGAFTEAAVRAMARHVARPIVFPLSNPTSKSEAVPADLLRWTDGRALVATGSPFAPVDFLERTYPISQCNNAYIFPGLGLGLIAAGATRVTDELFLTAARVLSAIAPPAGDGPTPLLPPVPTIQDVSRQIALAVGTEAMRRGVARRAGRRRVAENPRRPPLATALPAATVHSMRWCSVGVQHRRDTEPGWPDGSSGRLFRATTAPFPPLVHATARDRDEHHLVP